MGSPLTAEQWNFYYPAGTLVAVQRGPAERRVTRTRSLAWELGHGTPVVLVDGYTGGIALKRLTVGGYDRG